MTAARIAGIAGIAAGAVAVALALTFWLGLRASLPVISGTVAMPELRGKVLIERDVAGVPTIRAQTRNDLARGLGYAHAQDRYFQMDLLRRAAAGELSALLGPALLPTDRRLRLHQFRSVAREVVVRLGLDEKAMLDSYVGGVNAGLESLRSRPFEYWLLRQRPRPWSAEDSILCIHAMYLQLQDAQGRGQLQRGLLHAELPAALWRYLEAGTPEWDAAVDGSIDDEPQLPGSNEFDLRRVGALLVRPPGSEDRPSSMLGSNNWAVAGSRTADGAAIIANDMHLGFHVPNLWYRTRLVETDGSNLQDVTGVTLPGTPSVVAGSNGSIAWGFTNSYGSFATVVRLVAVAGDDTAYATADGPRKIEYRAEQIDVSGAPPEHMVVPFTRWGPILGKDWLGRPYAFRWAAQNPEATNLNLMQLERTVSVAQALRLAPGFGMPGQNLMVADKDGHIGWTIAGRLPDRRNQASGLPRLSTDGGLERAGWLPPERQPRVVDPSEGYLWSANARVVGGAAALLIGDDGMDRGSRAKQIHQDLQLSKPPFTPLASLAIQLDDRAQFLERWKTLMTDVIAQSQASGSRQHDPAGETLRGWSGRAVPEDAAYRLVVRFREEVAARVFFMLVSPARARSPDFEFVVPSSFEGPLWRILQRRPPHLLAANFSDWNAFLLSALDESEKLPPGCVALASCTWGRVNAVHVAHPLSRALPWLAPLLDMPVKELAGGREDMPRIQGPDFGASERFSVAPGRETHGYFHMPGAQSGHPLSPFYRSGFEDWARGRPTPFLPGAAAYTLVLEP